MTEGRTNEVPGYGYGEPDTAHSPRPSTNDQWGREEGRNHLLGHPISDQHLIQGCRALGVAGSGDRQPQVLVGDDSHQPPVLQHG
jgi:hypothetical protein